MTPEEKADYLTAKHKVRIQKLFNEAKKLPHLPRNIDHRAKRMIAIADEMASFVAPWSGCKKGCGHCCHQAVAISSWEAERIAEATGKTISYFEPHPIDGTLQKVLMEKFTKEPCPFLVDSQCSIYDVRPLVCNMHFSLADDDFPCDIINNQGARVPYYNFQELHFLTMLMFMSADCKYGDIREFFGPSK